MKAIVLLGGPGAGKGSLAEILKKNTPYTHVSTGDMLRAAVKAGTPVGLEAKPAMDAGKLVCDQLILKIIKERIHMETKGVRFMFDGFPRTVEQAEGLQAILEEVDGGVTHVLNLNVDPDKLIQRLCGRRTCKKCGAIFHVENMPPKEEGVCDLCGGDLYQRDDDNEQTVMNRLDVYNKQTAPLIDFYRRLGVLHDLDANGTIEQTAQRALTALNS